MRPSRRITQFAALLVVAAIAIAGCRENPDASDATSAKTTGTATTPLSDAALKQTTFAARVFGAIDQAGSAKVSFESDNGEDQTRGDGEVKYGDELAMRFDINLNPAGDRDDTSEVLLVGKTMYQKGISEGNRPTDGKYNAMSLTALESMGLPDIVGFLDPRSKADLFRTAVASFRRAGAAETLDGVEAMPYAVTIDASKVHESSPDGNQHYTFFVGPDDLPRKLVFRDGYSTFTTTYTHWGTSVDIMAPSNDDVDRLPSAP